MKSCAVRVRVFLGLRELTLEMSLNGTDGGVWHMGDNRPLSDNEADDRLKAALNALGEAPGVTVSEVSCDLNTSYIPESALP
jgi:hypothetical protein